MHSSTSLSLMRIFATFSLLSSLIIAYLINPIDDSLLFQGLDTFVHSIYGNEVISKLNNSIVAGVLLGLFIGTSFVFLGLNRSVYDYTLISCFTFFLLIFLAAFINYDSIPYIVFQQLFVWFWIGLPVVIGIVGIWNNNISNQIISASLILVMPLGLSGNDNNQIHLILGFIFSFILFLELGYAHVRYSNLARIMHYSKEYETVIQWFLSTLLITLALTTGLTSLAFLFHTFLGDALPYSFSNSIEFNTIYGQALSVLVFFIFWAVLQTLFSRGYLARQIED